MPGPGVVRVTVRLGCITNSHFASSIVSIDYSVTVETEHQKTGHILMSYKSHHMVKKGSCKLKYDDCKQDNHRRK